MTLESWVLQQRQSLPLNLKIERTKLRIREWYESHSGLIYPAFSGGIDSTALADIALKLYPDLPLVFCNTGMESDEIIQFVRSQPNIVEIRPKHSYKWICDNYGYPVISKEVSKNISRYRNTKSDIQRELRLHGGINPTSGKIQKTGVIPKKYHYLIDAPFKISDKCCDILKKNPAKLYDKETGRAPMTGEMAADSNKRTTNYLARGCNYYGKQHKSTPIGFWTRQDVLEYLLKFNVPYCPIYGEIKRNPTTELLYTTNEQHTGCGGFMFGIQYEDEDNNRFTRMKVNDPIHYNMYINSFGQGKVLDFMGVKY
jgi:3'-phosphoadenosine 5'-phosphosulfate sulfotransferase (PAPS reductase)/FAD synthetase